MLKKLLALFALLIASVGFALAAVNINTATEKELESLSGVGPAKAKAIVDYRKTNGNFKAIEDIKNVKGIGDKIFEKLKPQISVTGATAMDAAPKATKSDSKAIKEEPKAMQSAAKPKK